MSNPPTIQTNPLDPVFSGVPVAYPQTGLINPTWNKWFVDLREKVNVINATVAALSGGTLRPVLEVHAGTNVDVDNTDIQNPVVSATGGGGGGLTPLTSSVVVLAGNILIPTKAAKLVTFLINGTSYVLPCFPYMTVGAYDTEVLADSPYAYWKLDETSGTTALDSSGNGRNGIYIGGPTLGSTSIMPNGIGTSAYFNGTSAYMDCGFSPSDPYWTLEAWCSPNHVPQIGNASGPLYGVNRSLIFDHPTSSFIGSSSVNVGSFYAAQANPAITLSNRHFVGTFNGSQLLFYVDGVLVGSVNVSGTTVADTSHLLAARHPTATSNFLQASLQNLAYYNYALTAQRVAVHFAAGSQ